MRRVEDPAGAVKGFAAGVASIRSRWEYVGTGLPTGVTAFLFDVGIGVG
jgi:hypothetical protein